MSAGFPTLAQVEAAGVEQVLRWNRFMPLPQSDDDIVVIVAVVDRLGKLREQNPAAFTAASKNIGWDAP